MKVEQLQVIVAQMEKQEKDLKSEIGRVVKQNKKLSEQVMQQNKGKGAAGAAEGKQE